jgi:hypothetical protein
MPLARTETSDRLLFTQATADLKYVLVTCKRDAGSSENLERMASLPAWPHL